MKRWLTKGLKAALIAVLCVGMLFSTAAAAVGYTADRQLLLDKTQQAAVPGEITYTSLYDIQQVAKSDIQAAADLNRDYGSAVFLQFNTLDGAKILGRIVVNPFLATGADRQYDFRIAVNTESANKVQQQFEELLGKKVRVIVCGQQDYGMPIALSAKLDFTGVGTTGLSVYSYNAQTGTHKLLEQANCSVDESGYVHLQTRGEAGYLVIAGA